MSSWFVGRATRRHVRNSGISDSRADLPPAGADTVVDGMSAVSLTADLTTPAIGSMRRPASHLGHRRLSILDLSAAGHQPMVSASGRYVMIFNGEIYDHLELRREIEQAAAAPPWRGHSDTEILLAGFEAWGIEATLRKAAGMFAFALWDRQQRTLTLARDRMGEKPLYYGWQGGILLFGSELKALRAHPAFRADIDRRVLAGYFRRGYITAPHCIYRGIFKLLPGSYLQFSSAGTDVCGRDAIGRCARWRPSSPSPLTATTPRP